MIVYIKSLAEQYKDDYNKLKFKYDYYKILVESQDRKIKELEEELNAYKILLKKELNK